MTTKQFLFLLCSVWYGNAANKNQDLKLRVVAILMVMLLSVIVVATEFEQ